MKPVDASDLRDEAIGIAFRAELERRPPRRVAVTPPVTITRVVGGVEYEVIPLERVLNRRWP